MLSKQDGPGAIRVVLIATFRLLPEHPVCSTFFFFQVFIAEFLLTLLFTMGLWLIVWHIATTPSWNAILANTRQYHFRKTDAEQTGWSRSNSSRPDCYLRTAPGASGLLNIVFFNGLIAMFVVWLVFTTVVFPCLTTSSLTIVKSNASKTNSNTTFEENNVEQTGWSRSNPGRPDCYLLIASGASSLLNIAFVVPRLYC